MDEMEFQEADKNVRDLITEYQDKQDAVVDLDEDEDEDDEDDEDAEDDEEEEEEEERTTETETMDMIETEIETGTEAIECIEIMVTMAIVTDNRIEDGIMDVGEIIDMIMIIT
eukprot:1146972_1